MGADLTSYLKLVICTSINGWSAQPGLGTVPAMAYFRKSKPSGSPPMTAPQVARHMGALVRQARLALLMTQQTAALNARVSVATLKRIEDGEMGVSLGSWLAAFQAVSMLQQLAALSDPVAQAVLGGTGVKRGGRRRPFPNEDYDHLDSDA